MVAWAKATADLARQRHRDHQIIVLAGAIYPSQEAVRQVPLCR